jgi:hypothetical protein
MALVQRTQLPVGVRPDSRTSVGQLKCRPFQRLRNARIRTSAAASNDMSPHNVERRGVLLAGASSLLAMLQLQTSQGARISDSCCQMHTD